MKRLGLCWSAAWLCWAASKTRSQIPGAARRAEQAGAGVVRVLAAILPLRAETWVFKMANKVELVHQHKDDFDEFIRSVQVTGKAATR